MLAITGATAPSTIKDLFYTGLYTLTVILVFVLALSVCKKLFKFIVDFILPYIEFGVLIFFVPIGLAFYAARSTQHVGQSYFRKLFNVGILNSIRLIGLNIIIWLMYDVLKIGTWFSTLIPSGTFSSASDYGVNEHGYLISFLGEGVAIHPGITATIGCALATVLVVHIAEAWINKSEQVSSAIVGH